MLGEYIAGHRALMIVTVCYVVLLSLVSVIVTCWDKSAAKKHPDRRVREASLLWLSAFGGSAAMLLTMLIIRHKTQHLKFMIGIPVIILIQLAAIVIFLFRAVPAAG